MIKVFIGGSRRISKLNREIKNRLDNIIQHKFTVFVGDANGADKAVQNYLFFKKYEQVLVFCMGNKCRNNVGNWKTRNIQVAIKNKNYNFYTAKDLQMVSEADFGFMIWDAKSKGTLRNIVNLLKESKKTLAYFAPERNFYKLTSFNDLHELLKKCDNQILDLIEKEFGLQMHPPLDNEQKLGINLGHLNPARPTLWSSRNAMVIRDKQG